jgi:DNA-binding LytR/AlgR family response regulator
MVNKYFPQNFLIRKPLIGTLVFLAFCFGFVVMYKPLHVHEAWEFSFEISMAIYLASISIPLFFIILLLKKIPYYSDPEKWNILKEVSAIVLILLVMGIAIYFMGFLMEKHENRWNFATLFDSCKNAFLVGIIPMIFFTLMNYRHLFATDISRNFNPETDQASGEKPEELIRISSQLKKEELNFYPGQFVYAESDSNYVIFYLHVNTEIQKKIIRNSISNIEQQLSLYPYLMRTHRAFIVNVKKVSSQKGNSLGYRLELDGIDASIPVSRQKTHDFDLLIKQYR